MNADSKFLLRRVGIPLGVLAAVLYLMIFALELGKPRGAGSEPKPLQGVSMESFTKKCREAAQDWAGDRPVEIDLGNWEIEQLKDNSWEMPVKMKTLNQYGIPVYYKSRCFTVFDHDANGKEGWVLHMNPPLQVMP